MFLCKCMYSKIYKIDKNGKIVLSSFDRLRNDVSFVTDRYDCYVQEFENIDLFIVRDKITRLDNVIGYGYKKMFNIFEN